MRRASIGVAAFMAGAVTLVVIGVAIHSGTSAPTPHPTPTPTPNPLDTATGVTAHGAVIAWLAAIGILPFFAYAAIALRARYRARLLEPDNPPLRYPEFAHRFYDVRALEARRGWLPASFTYSPHMRNDAIDVEPQPALAPHIPTLSLEDLMRGPGVTYGVDVATGQPVTDDQVRSLLVGGIPGSGKSTLVTLVVAQLVQRGASVSLGDPHYPDRESLGKRLEALGITVAVESEARLIRERVETAALEIQSRKHSTDRRPLIVVVDELPEQIRLLGDRDRERLREALEIIGFGGRKFGVSAILLAQSWTRATIGGTAIRNLVPSAAIFRMRRDEALAMSGIRAETWPDDPINLPPGEAYLVGISSDITHIRVPFPPPPPTRARAGLPPPSDPLPPTSRVLPDRFPTPELEVGGKRLGSGAEALVLTRFREGLSINAIVREMTGERGGRGFQEAHEEALAIIRRALA